MANQLPKFGEEIPVEKLHVSPMNVRADDPFGESEEDKSLINQLWSGKIVGPFKARPEREGYGVYVGRRRFLAKKETGTKHFVVGADVIIDDVSEDEAKEQSLIENLHILRQDMDPVTRAQKLNEIISSSSRSLRETARQLGLSPSTLSEWLKILELSPKMQEALKQRLLPFRDALKLARAPVSSLKMEYELAEVLETEGLEPFRRELERLSEKKLKKGVPKGKYLVLRTLFKKDYQPDMKLIKGLGELAKANNMKVHEYVKKVLKEHLTAEK
jgi:ParB family chromosome partitioning protein